jgi:LPS-assembly protein
VETSARTDAEWNLDYDFQNSRVNASSVLLNYHLGQMTLGGGDAILEIPGQTATSSSGSAEPARFNQFRAALGYGSLTKRGFSAAGSFGFDADVKQLQFVSAQSTYNWTCCGVTLEYRTYTVANVRNENLFLINFSLGNVGSLGSLRQLGRLY